MVRHHFTWLLLAPSFWLFCAESASAARLLNFSVELNGQKNLTAIHDDNGLADAATVWSYLRDKELSVEAGAQLPIKGNDPLQCQMQGNIVIRVIHAGKVIAESKVTDLR